MKIIKRIILLVLFVIGVFLANANLQSTELVLIPDYDIPGWPAPASVRLPLFLIVLGCVLLGGLLIAMVAAVERVRLQAALRRTRKDKDRLQGELGATREKLELVSTELEQARREIAEQEARERELRAEAAEERRTPEHGGAGQPESLAAGGESDDADDSMDSPERQL